MKKDYYKGGYRVIIKVAPCKVFVKPSAHMLAEWNGTQHKPAAMPKTIEAWSQLRFPQTTYTPIGQEEERKRA